MKERPILFSAPMVRALLDGTKTQTRRIVKPQPVLNGHFWELFGAGWSDRITSVPAVPGHSLAANCPYGQPGDRLWVKETFAAFGRWETRFNAKKGRDEWHFVDMTLECGPAYRFDLADVKGTRTAGAVPTWHIRSSLFMPRAASRILLDNSRVRVERLNECSEADAIAEGIAKFDSGWLNYDGTYPVPLTATQSYRSLWEQINGPGSWEANPWVWVVEFPRLGSRKPSI